MNQDSTTLNFPTSENEITSTKTYTINSISPISVDSFNIDTTLGFELVSPNILNGFPGNDFPLQQQQQEHTGGYENRDEFPLTNQQMLINEVDSLIMLSNINYNESPASSSLSSSMIFPNTSNSMYQISENSLSSPFSQSGISLHSSTSTSVTNNCDGITGQKSKSTTKVLKKPKGELTTTIRKKKYLPRSRHACNNCRLKKLKCDEQKPQCSRCSKKGYDCVYHFNVQFKQDVEARGKRFGREGINSTTINAISKNSNSHDDNINSNTNSSSNEENNIITTTTDKLIELSGKSYYTKIKNINNVKFINFYNFDINQNDYNQTDSNCYQKLQLQKQQRKYSEEYTTRRGGGDIYSRISRSLQPSIIPHDLMIIEGFKMLQDANSLSHALNYYIHFISPILNPMDQYYYNVDNIQPIEIVTTNPNTEEDEYDIQVNNDNNKYKYKQVTKISITIEKGLDLHSLIKYSQNNSIIFLLMLSLGSMYLYKLNTDQGANTDNAQQWLNNARYFQYLALKRIQPIIEQLINQQEENINGKFGVDLLISLVLLILYEFSNNCNKNWTIYLKLSKKLLTSTKFEIPQKKSINSLEYSILKFCLQFLDYQESMGRTACKDVNLFFLDYAQDEEEEEEEKSIEQQKQIDGTSNIIVVYKNVNLISWMGCDKQLMSIISDITDLSFERFKKSINEIDYNLLCQDMQKRLNDMKLNINIPDHQQSTEIVKDNKGNTKEITKFLLSCEVKRLSTELYLQCCLLNQTPEDEIVYHLVFDIFTKLEYLILNQSENSTTSVGNGNSYSFYLSLIWPIFMAASEISTINENCESLRYLTLQIFDKLESNTLGNTNKIKQIIINIWKKRDLINSTIKDKPTNGQTKDDGLKSKRRKRLMGFVNDWEKYVVEEDYAIALT